MEVEKVIKEEVNSGLAKDLREREYEFEKNHGWRIKVVERTGRILESMLTTSNPWRGRTVRGRHAWLLTPRKGQEKTRPRIFLG